VAHPYEEIDTLARTIYGEARGEPMQGKIAVAWCVRNRVEHPKWWGKSWLGVMLKPKQFSCWNPEDRNRTKLAGVTFNDKDFRDCWYAALAVYQNMVKDPAPGSTHYYAYDLMDEPFWAEGATSCGRIAGHEYFKGVR
tara:strand:+ start:380 stop:793 length:414 start_codon:yes stop_codon:yes gene_type:complete